MIKRHLLGATAALALLAGLNVTANADPVTLDFPTWQADEPGFGEFYKGAIAAFQEANPDVTIQLQQIPFADYIPQMTVRFSSGRPPHILVIPSDNFGLFADQGWLTELDDRIVGGALETEWTSLQNELVWDGKTQGMLMMGYGFMLFYNQALLDQAGVAVPSSFEEFRAAVSKITNRDAGIFGLAAVTTEHPTVALDFIRFIEWQGESFLKDGNYNLTDPGVVRAITNYRETVGGNAPLGNNSTVARQLFTEGKTAFLIDGPWMYNTMNGASAEVRPNLHMIKAPFSPVLGGASNSVHIPAGHDEHTTDHVRDFINFLGQPEWQEKFTQLTASPSGRVGVLSEASIAATPHLAVIAEGAVGALPIIPNVPQIRANSAEFSAILRRTALKVLSTDEAIEGILAEAQAELERTIPLS